MSNRNEFSKATKRAALARSNMLCEAIGTIYNLPQGQRCNAPLSAGVDFDHIVADALGGDNSLDNCAAVCRVCHKFKTAKNDTPKAAKVKRASDKANGIKPRKLQIKSQGFPKAEKRPNTLNKSLPPRRSIYQEE